MRSSASAIVRGDKAFATMANFAGQVMMSFAAPHSAASTIRLAARVPSMLITGIDPAMANQVNSSRCRPLNQALKGDPVHIRPGHTVVM